MPQLLAPDDLLPLATPYWQALAPAWTVEIRRVSAAEIDGAYGLTSANTTTSRATILIDETLVGRDLDETLRHEMSHVNAWSVTELLDHSDPRAVALFEPMIERFALAIGGATGRVRAVARMRTARARATAAGVARDGAHMDGKAVLEAVKTQDGAAALTILDGWLVEMIAGAMGDAGMPAEEAAPLEGEDAPAMMRRVLKAALARKAPVATLADTGFTAKVLQRLGAKTEGEALLRIAALKVADSQVEDLAVADDMLARKAAATATMKRTNIPRPVFFVDGKDELQPEWLEGTLEEVERTFAAMKRGGRPIARPRVEADIAAGAGDVEIPDAVKRFAARKGRGNDVAYMQRLAAELPNGGSLPQES